MLKKVLRVTSIYRENRIQRENQTGVTFMVYLQSALWKWDGFAREKNRTTLQTMSIDRTNIEHLMTSSRIYYTQVTQLRLMKRTVK